MADDNIERMTAWTMLSKRHLPYGNSFKTVLVFDEFNKNTESHYTIDNYKPAFLERTESNNYKISKGAYAEL